MSASRHHVRYNRFNQPSFQHEEDDRVSDGDQQNQEQPVFHAPDPPAQNPFPVPGRRDVGPRQHAPPARMAARRPVNNDNQIEERNNPQQALRERMEQLIGHDVPEITPSEKQKAFRKQMKENKKSKKRKYQENS